MSLITQEQVQEMFEMQDAMNSVVYLDWKTRNFDWELAGHMELMEGVDHYGWKWWKQQGTDLPQVQLEVVDAFHFWLSYSIVNEDTMYGHIADQINAIFLTNDLIGWSEDTCKRVYQAIAKDYQGLISRDGLWGDLLKSVKMTPQDLYEMYVKKNVLNFFRQDNGYKEGTYIKIWKGEEDNVHLLRIADKLLKEGIFSRFTLYEALEECYEEVLSLG